MMILMVAQTLLLLKKKLPKSSLDPSTKRISQNALIEKSTAQPHGTPATMKKKAP